MRTSLTIVKYPAFFIPFAFFAMAVHRLPLWLNKKIFFYKLMGTGRNGTFDKTPDFRQWALLTVFDEKLLPASQNGGYDIQRLYGSFIAGWFRFFKCSVHTYLLQPVEGHGLWDGKNPFGSFTKTIAAQEQTAVLTRATIRLNKLKYFWQNVAPVAAKMNTAKGFITSYGVGEIPWIKQATFSVWQTKDDMKAFAYGMKEHAEVIKKTRKQDWYSEEMFVRFQILKEYKF